MGLKIPQLGLSLWVDNASLSCFLAYLPYIYESDFKYHGNYDLNSGYMFYSKWSRETMKGFLVNLVNRLNVYILDSYEIYKFVEAW